MKQEVVQQRKGYGILGGVWAEKMFETVLSGSLILSFGFGIFLTGIKPAPLQIHEKISQLKTRFLIQEEPKSAAGVTAPVKKAEAKPSPKRAVDLTRNPKLKAEEDVVAEKVEDPKPVRRVYGLRKVYSKGLGTGGSLADAVVGKLGNTLDKEVDTLTATSQEIKGKVVSVTTIVQAPKFMKIVKPEYTSEMLKNDVEGVVKVKVLVDVDGKVKKAQALNDLGFDAAKQALKASLAMEFSPAMRDDGPVAVWIIIPVRFVLLG